MMSRAAQTHLTGHVFETPGINWIRHLMIDTRNLHLQLLDESLADCYIYKLNIPHSTGVTFWTYLIVRTILGVLTAASLMMFEGAVMATVQEMGGDYGIQVPITL